MCYIHLTFTLSVCNTLSAMIKLYNNLNKDYEVVENNNFKIGTDIGFESIIWM